METFQQPKLTGYRQLSEEDAVLMNEIKAKGEELRALVGKIEARVIQEHEAAMERDVESMASGKDDLESELETFLDTDPYGWIVEGAMSLNKGLMFLTRAVARPTHF